MLTKLSIQNYALIDDVHINFSKGFTTITGETGAGKSILLGGLGLVLGNRADSSALMNPDKKCIIEAEFELTAYNLEAFFETNDVDYDSQTIIRRELLPSGKSRAFINDTPVTLSLLNGLHKKLIDIHSQHQTLQLNDSNFQFTLVDALAESTELIKIFYKKRKYFNQLQDELTVLQQQLAQEKEQEDYNLFLYRELEEAHFLPEEQEELESQLQQHSHSELIQQNLQEAFHLLANEELGLLSQLYTVKTDIGKLENFSKSYKDLSQRLESSYIELKDIEAEVADNLESLSFDPDALDRINQRLQLLYDLFKKHQVASIKELLLVQDTLKDKIDRISNADELIHLKEQEIANVKNELIALGNRISDKRKKSIPDLEKKVTNLLGKLGMPDARFEIKLNQTVQFYHNGMDELEWLFSANKGGRLGSLKQVASGGELSRIMLAVKAILASYSKLPTILFDEIDTGVSGEIALKMGEIMQTMAKKMQVISITHLPQIAAKGTEQFKVYKFLDNKRTKTNIKVLNDAERVLEIAEMLGGKNMLDTAKKHALQLLQLKK